MEEVALRIHRQLVAVSSSPDANQTDHIEKKKGNRCYNIAKDVQTLTLKTATGKVTGRWYGVRKTRGTI